jgi:hypothetical protein
MLISQNLKSRCYEEGCNNFKPVAHYLQLTVGTVHIKSVDEEDTVKERLLLLSMW